MAPLTAFLYRSPSTKKHFANAEFGCFQCLKCKRRRMVSRGFDDAVQNTCAVLFFCLQGKLLSSKVIWGERGADLVSCSTVFTLLSCSFFAGEGSVTFNYQSVCVSNLCLSWGLWGEIGFKHPLLKYFQQGKRRKCVVMRSSAPRRERPVVLSKVLSKETFRPDGQISLWLLSIKTASLRALVFVSTVGPLELYSYQMGPKRGHSWRTRHAWQHCCLRNSIFTPQGKGGRNPSYVFCVLTSLEKYTKQLFLCLLREGKPCDDCWCLQEG